jgi:vitamin B12/bleomycin/antimicrobial peptide transport system ATP-binding/permease protein
MMFIPQQNYLPPGTLRGALAYPSEDFVAALERRGLGNLSLGLDRIARWDRETTDEEQQKLTFARLLLHKPRWVLLDEAIDHLDGDTRAPWSLTFLARN